MARRGITKPAEMEAAITGKDISQQPTNDEIAARAYGIYVREGRIEGREMDHWLRAESELLAERRNSKQENRSNGGNGGNGSRNEQPGRLANGKSNTNPQGKRAGTPEKMAV